MKTRMLLLLLLLAACLVASGMPAAAADWPQWRGPDRTGVSKETGLLKAWPKEGPKLLGLYKNAGVGYSCPAIVGDHLYTMGARGDSEFVIALDVKNPGAIKELWATRVGPTFTFMGNQWGDGPRATPTVDGGLVYALGGFGDLVCVEAASGKEVWRKSMRKDLGGVVSDQGGLQDGIAWGYTWSPLVDGKQVICVPGGEQGTLAALDKVSGAVHWRSKELTDSATYSSPIIADVDGNRTYVQVTDFGTAAVAAKDGKLAWRYKRAKYPDVVIPTPLYHDKLVYATAGWGAGCDLVKLAVNGSEIQATKGYANKNMKNAQGGVVLLDGHVYGYSEQRGWVCQDFKTGKVVWDEKNMLGQGSVIAADGRLYCNAEDYTEGGVALLEASTEGYKEHGRFDLPESSKMRKPGTRRWTPPVIADGKLYLRDQELLFCYAIK